MRKPKKGITGRVKEDVERRDTSCLAEEEKKLQLRTSAACMNHANREGNDEDLEVSSKEKEEELEAMRPRETQALVCNQAWLYQDQQAVMVFPYRHSKL